MIMFSQRYKENSLIIGLLSVHETKAAEEDIVRIVQNQTFSDELQLLTKSTNEQLLPKSSRLFKLNVVIINGILRISSRLINCELKGDFRQPIIMPHDHPATKSSIEYYYSIEGHMDTNQNLSALRYKFWIIKGQRTVRNVIESCLRCKKLTAKACEQSMIPLPIERLAVNERRFSSVGVDYFGPFHVKRSRVLEKDIVAFSLV